MIITIIKALSLNTNMHILIIEKIIHVIIEDEFAAFNYEEIRDEVDWYDWSD